MRPGMKRLLELAEAGDTVSAQESARSLNVKKKASPESITMVAAYARSAPLISAL